MLEKQKGFPTDEGFYFITEPKKNYWIAIVRVYGSSPFMRVEMIKRTSKTDDVKDVVEGVLTNPTRYIYSQMLDYKTIK